jgi:OOP family OmpA-OmpF porin
MKTNPRFTQQLFKVSNILLVFFAIIIYSKAANGQLMANAGHIQSDQTQKNAPVKINLLEGVNFQAKASLLGHGISSAYEELKPAFAPQGEIFYFSRLQHPNNTGGELDREDIWYATFDTLSLSWSEPALMPGFLNNSGPNYIESVSMTGDTIILGNQYYKKGKMKAGVSYSVNIMGEWTVPTPIIIKNDYNISQHANHHISLKTGIIISAIERVETLGDRDLYVSFWNGEYATEPMNMGAVINTELEESSPYLAPDNKTLYFASKGHNGYGGYDIYMTTRLDESWTSWSEPRNLGPAVNGSLDEEFFSLTHCGGFAVFSKQVSVHNVDLFRVDTTDLFGKHLIGAITVKRPRGAIGAL